MVELKKDSFFTMYPEFKKRTTEYNNEFNFLLYNNEYYLKKAVKNYFKNTIGCKEVELTEKHRSAAGSQVIFFLLH